MGAIWVGTMSLLPKSLLKIGCDLGRHHIILPTQIAPMGAIWVGSDLGTYIAAEFQILDLFRSSTLNIYDLGSLFIVTFHLKDDISHLRDDLK